MKRFLTLASALAIAASAMTSVSAASSDILKGTPKVDGVFDEIYNQTVSIGYDDTNKGYLFGGYTAPYSLDFKSYFLYDNDYFYVCTVVTDNDLVDVGADTYKSNPTNWQADAVEFWFNKGDKAKQFKTHTDAFGQTMFFGDGTAPFATSDCKKAVKMNDKGYVVEVAYPVAKVKGLMTGDKIKVQTQVNDIVEKGKGVALYSKAFDLALSNTEVTYPKVVETKPAAAATADPIALALAGIALAGAAVAASKKRG